MFESSIHLKKIVSNRREARKIRRLVRRQEKADKKIAELEKLFEEAYRIRNGDDIYKTTIELTKLEGKEVYRVFEELELINKIINQHILNIKIAIEELGKIDPKPSEQISRLNQVLDQIGKTTEDILRKFSTVHEGQKLMNINDEGSVVRDMKTFSRKLIKLSRTEKIEKKIPDLIRNIRAKREQDISVEMKKFDKKLEKMIKYVQTEINVISLFLHQNLIFIGLEMEKINDNYDHIKQILEPPYHYRKSYGEEIINELSEIGKKSETLFKQREKELRALLSASKQAQGK